MSESLVALMDDTSQEIEALRRDARTLKKELSELQQSNSRLADLLFAQRQALQNLLQRIGPGEPALEQAA